MFKKRHAAHLNRFGPHDQLRDELAAATLTFMSGLPEATPNHFPLAHTICSISTTAPEKKNIYNKTFPLFQLLKYY